LDRQRHLQLRLTALFLILLALFLAALSRPGPARYAVAGAALLPSGHAAALPSSTQTTPITTTAALQSPTSTLTVTPTITVTPMPAVSATSIPTATAALTPTTSMTSTATSIMTPTAAATPSPTPTATPRPTASATRVPLTLVSISPATIVSGNAASLTLRGSGFDDSAAATIGSARCAVVSVRAGSTLVCRPGALAPGTYAVQVRLSDGRISRLSHALTVLPRLLVQIHVVPGGSPDQASLLVRVLPGAKVRASATSGGRALPGSAVQVAPDGNGLWLVRIVPRLAAAATLRITVTAQWGTQHARQIASVRVAAFQPPTATPTVTATSTPTVTTTSTATSTATATLTATATPGPRPAGSRLTVGSVRLYVATVAREDVYAAAGQSVRPAHRAEDCLVVEAVVVAGDADTAAAWNVTVSDEHGGVAQTAFASSITYAHPRSGHLNTVVWVFEVLKASRSFVLHFTDGQSVWLPALRHG